MTDTTAKPRDLIDVALDAAFPGLPAGMTMEEARRRITKAIAAVEPLIRRQVEGGVSDRIRAYGESTGDRQTARVYERIALGE